MLEEILRESVLFADMQAASIVEVIDRLLESVCAGDGVRDRAAARAAILDNEERMATGMQHGIAIPHAKTPVVDRLVAALGVTRDPLRMPGPEGAPTRIFLLVLAPPDGVGVYLRFLAEMGRLLKQRALRQRLLAAATRREMADALLLP